MSARNILSSAFIVLVAGCTVVQPDEPQAVELKEITISAYRADEQQPESKTQRDEQDGSLWWTPGDAISLFYGSGTEGGNRFVSTATQPSKVTNFTGTIGVITGGADVSLEDTYFWGLYPYNATASCDGSSVTTTLPNEQVATPGTFANNLFPSLGRSQGLTMGFYNICGGVRFTVTKEGLKKVTLRALGGEALTGTARIGFENGVPKVLEITNGSDEITLTAPDGEFLEVGRYYYFITFPQPLSQGIEMKFETFTEEGTYTRQTSNLTIKRSIFGTLNNVDQNVVYAQKVGNIPVEDANFKAYLVENFDADGDGEISYQEADNVNNITFSYLDKHITSIKGIEYFPNLDTLFCSYDGHQPGIMGWYLSKDDTLEHCLDSLRTVIDGWKKAGPFFPLEGNLSLAANRKLKKLVIWNAMSLNSIDVSNCPDLEYLDIQGSLTTTHSTIDLTKNTKLKTLKMHGCVLVGTLDLSHCSDLVYADISRNAFSNIIWGNLPHLEALYVYSGYQPFESLSLAFCPELRRLEVSSPCISGGTDGRGYIPHGHLRSLDVSHNTKLEYLSCCGCNIEEPLDLSNCPLLKSVQAFYNEFEVFTLGNHPDLEILYLAGCWHLEELDLSGCPSLDWISTYTCWSLTPVDYASCTHLKTLYQPPSGSNLTACTEVEYYDGLPEFLSCFPHLKSYSHWHFSSLDLSANPELEVLWIGTTNCTTIDLSPLVNLKTLTVDGWSTFSVLDISHNLALTDVTFEGSEALQTLYVAEGQQIEGITVNRSDSKIHPNTQILVSPNPGGGEDPGDENW